MKKFFIFVSFHWCMFLWTLMGVTSSSLFLGRMAHSYIYNRSLEISLLKLNSLWLTNRNLRSGKNFNNSLLICQPTRFQLQSIMKTERLDIQNEFSKTYCSIYTVEATKFTQGVIGKWTTSGFVSSTIRESRSSILSESHNWYKGQFTPPTLLILTHISTGMPL